MKKTDYIQLAASLCLLFGSIINLVDAITDVSFVLKICTIPLLLASIVLYGIAYKRNKEKSKNDKSDENKG